ncbi:hypothetical protein [Spirosoma telluris]|uniref:hypothetical protein n=1 Tax=Spirosoma telluris TaxID=2183553 RepID=UPI002FC3A95F
MEYKKALRKLIDDFKTNFLPSVSLDLVIFGFHDGQLKVLLLRWKGTDDWCLPGGEYAMRRIWKLLPIGAYSNELD